MRQVIPSTGFLWRILPPSLFHKLSLSFISCSLPVVNSLPTICTSQYKSCSYFSLEAFNPILFGTAPPPPLDQALLAVSPLELRPLFPIPIPPNYILRDRPLTRASCQQSPIEPCSVHHPNLLNRPTQVSPYSQYYTTVQ